MPPMAEKKKSPTEGWVQDYWGWCRLRWNERALTGAEWFKDAPLDAAKKNAKALVWHELLLKHWRTGSPLEIELAGTPFQIEVWNLLREVKFGQTITYGELAARLGKPEAARAVGGAVGENKIGLAVPCHRVLPAGGGLGGFRWGLPMKESVLRGEGVKVAPLPKK